MSRTMLKHLEKKEEYKDKTTKIEWLLLILIVFMSYAYGYERCAIASDAYAVHLVSGK